ncbi:methyl-accepting chemotaxis protein [Thalassobacillus hwangdonensis]|uniref:Methyl-accepting chemotaxis protein n=1 Tax=Thalassobacillus hwangdonensis TaxID=546108 RepID=A0ABW3L2P0_9BACI
MRKWKDAGIGWKYGIAYISTIVFFLIAIVIVFVELNLAKNDVMNLADRGNAALNVSEMASIARTKDIRIADYIREPRSSYVEEFEQNQQAFNTIENNYRESLQDSELEKLMVHISEVDKEINAIFLDQIVGNSSNTSMVSDLRLRTQGLRKDLVDSLEELEGIVLQHKTEAEEDAEASIDLTMLILLVSVGAAIILGAVLMYIVNRSVRKRLNELVTVSDQIADGELYHDDIAIDRKDEIGMLGQSIMTMKSRLKELIAEITTLSTAVDERSEGLKTSAQEVQEASEQVASTMEELSSASEQQASDASSLAELMDDFGRKIGQADDQGDRVAEMSRVVQTMSKDGQTKMDASEQKMTQIHTVMQEAVRKVSNLDRQSKEISKLVNVIKDIAEQTNLLALNAAIEAARAGEHGKGFAVVADEVRKLAEQVGSSVEEITTMVGSIQKDSYEVSQSLEQGYEEVEEGAAHIHSTGETFREINRSIHEMVAAIDHISNNLEEIADSSAEMNRSIESIASISEESAAGVEQTTASAQQTNSSMETITSNADDLSSMSKQLSERIRQFKLSNE